MKKKFISTLLLGAFFLASTSMVVSCKDYDDDINGLQTQVDQLSALKAAKTDVEAEIASLKTQLEAKDAELTTLISTAQKTADANKSSITTEVARAAAAESALEARIKTAESAIESINTVLAGKVDKTTYDTTVKDIYAKIEAVQTDLGSALTNISILKKGLEDEATARLAVKADLDQQAETLNGYIARLSKLETQTGLNTEDITTLKGNVSSLQTQIATLKNTVDNLGVTELKNQVQALSNSIDALKQNVTIWVNDLNVLIKTSLRSLVFRPDFYYWGIEATKVTFVKYFTYNTIPTAAWNKKETKGYDESIDLTKSNVARTMHARYDSTAASKVLAFSADYYLNPSSANITKENAVVGVVSDDKAYVNTRSANNAPCGITVKDWKTNEPGKLGMLTVYYDVSNPNLIKQVIANSAVTVFATQVNITKGALKDTTITSDFATLITDQANGFILAHTLNGDGTFTGVENTHCGVCPLNSPLKKNHLHLMATVAEAKTFLPQDSCCYKSTLDLRKLVETHWTATDGKHTVYSDADLKANGFTYRFDLTALYLGGNLTSESAHAAINPADGHTFRPQMPEYDKDLIGQQKEYGAKQDRQEIGRTPLVRVELVDTLNNKVVDYGYIRIKICDTITVKQAPLTHTYTAKWNYNYDCTVPGLAFQTKWIQTEYDLYNMLGITREEFEAHYRGVASASGDLKQYDASTFAPLSSAYGTINEIADASPEDGTLTNTLKWVLTSADAEKYFITNNMSQIKTAIKFESDDSYKSKYRDVYVVFQADRVLPSDGKPYGIVSWNEMNKNFWYQANANDASKDDGFVEIHAQTITPEDNKSLSWNASVFDDTFSDVFAGNTINPTITVMRDHTATQDYSNTTKTLVFDEKNEGKEYLGNDGNTYVMHVADNGMTLQAKIKNASPIVYQNVAIMIWKPTTAPQTLNNQAVEYQKTAYAEAMLNYAAHNKLADNVVTAIIGLKATVCSKTLPLTNNTFNVRFLRPINVVNKDTEIEDANITTIQTIQMKDLVLFTDWRDAWNNVYYAEGMGGEAVYNSGYAKYYDIQSIEVDHVANGQAISINSDVVTNQNQSSESTFKPLKDVNGATEFYYHSSTTGFGYLTYTNLSSTVEKFKVKIPVKVTYIWGTIYATATVTVNRTAHNAKNF